MIKRLIAAALALLAAKAAAFAYVATRNYDTATNETQVKEVIYDR